MEYRRLKDVALKDFVGDRVFLTFLARNIQVRLQKDNVTKYIVLDMCDKDTVVEARLFGAQDYVIELLAEGKVYNAAVDIKPYDRSPSGYSCIIYNIDISNLTYESFVDWSDNIENSRIILENTLQVYYDTIYGKIAYNMIVSNWQKFCVWTAASGMHHTQLGGLIVHTAEVIQTCECLAEQYNLRYGQDFINKALLMCAACIHDIGKIHELNVEVTSGKTEYSDESYLETHIMRVLSDIDIMAYKLGFGRQSYLPPDSDDEEDGVKSEETLQYEVECVKLLKHCVAAHHGKLEYGSPILSSIPEAFILHLADNLSASMFRYKKALKEGNRTSSQWAADGKLKYYIESSKLSE